MDIEHGASVVLADGKRAGTVLRSEQDYFQVQADDGATYWLSAGAVADASHMQGGEVRLRIASDDVERYRVQPVSAQSAQAREADTLSPGPVGRVATAGHGGEQEFSEELASDVAERRGADERDLMPERLAAAAGGGSQAAEGSSLGAGMPWRPLAGLALGAVLAGALARRLRGSRPQ